MSAYVGKERVVTDEILELEVKKWAAQLNLFTLKHMPFLEQEDKVQEGRVVLMKCLGNYKHSSKVKFHTNFYNALRNKAMSLGNGQRTQNGRKYPLNTSLVHNIDPNLVSSIDREVEVEDSTKSSPKIEAAISVGFSPGMLFLAESYGFTGTEAVYMAAKAEGLRLKEMPATYGLPLKELKKAKRTAQIKIDEMKRERLIENGT